MNLLADPVFRADPGGVRVTLPGLFAAMARSEVWSLAALRPHQRPAWHTFCVQLATLALWTDGREAPPEDEATWQALLRGLTPDHADDAPWCLAVDDPARPAFLQPPAVTALTWQPAPTPDALDLLITSRNHDLKQAVAAEAAPEDWAYALVSLQTAEGYGGAGNHGIARMNGGSSSRPCLGLAPAGDKDHTVDLSAWWAHDVARLLTLRAAGEGGGVGPPGGPALLWLLAWPEGGQLDPRKLDPLFIEVCRRVRLARTGDGFTASRATSKAPRIDAKSYKGNLGDPWTPVHAKDGKAFTLAGRDFSYRTLNELLFSGDWRLPPLAVPGPTERGDRLLIAEALSRGNSKTEGFKSRVVRVPGKVLHRYQTKTAGELAKVQWNEIDVFYKALGKALALVAADGDHDAVKSPHYNLAKPAQQRFDRAADAIFYPNLWHRLALKDDAAASGEDEAEARDAFLRALLTTAERELKAALPAMPCAATRRPRAEVRARRAFWLSIWKNYDHLSSKEHADAAA